MTPEDWQEFQQFLEFKRLRDAQQGTRATAVAMEPAVVVPSLRIRDYFEGHYRPFAEKKRSWKSVGRCHWVHLLKFFGDMHPDDLNYDKGDEYQRWRQAQKRLVPDGSIRKAGNGGGLGMKEGDRNVQPATINNELNSMRAMLNFLVKRRKITVNNLTGHQDLEVEQKRRFHCTEEDFLKILQHVPPVARLMFILSYETGMRRDEFRLLEWTEVNLQADPATITLPAWRVKGRKKGRTIALSKLAVDIIRAAPRLTPSKFVFPNPHETDGSEFPKSTLYTQFVTARTRANVKGPGDQNYWIHSLRKSYGVNNARRNMSIYELMKQMGHSSFEVHQEYTELSPDYLKSVAEVLNTSPPRRGPRAIEEAEREARRDTPSDDALREFVSKKVR